jgi:hypothetical protein
LVACINGALNHATGIILSMEASSAKAYTKELIGVMVTALIAFTIIPYAQTMFTAMNLTGVLAFAATLSVVLMTFGALLYIVEKLI